MAGYFIKKLDAGVNVLANCEHLSLHSNMIDKMAPVPLKKLKILALGRNNIKRIEKLEDCAATLEELWISYNVIDKLDGLSACRSLRIFYFGNNKIAKFDELLKLRDNPKLEEILTAGNPMVEGLGLRDIRIECLKRLPKLRKIDGVVVSQGEVDEATGGGEHAV